ncbi:hypothetical protein [Candidatus Thioglobus sp.]|uniref:hypothetical protein n=1 Tax=Candidatus Thioglobus sp. TaxID=2026721 RepID=UPI00175A2F62|nr:hypothetical protein [Candidatus Thioglobus sp.]HIF48137.1 hypothetical protein [Candidatus Thioglobus sp.]
MKVKLLFIFTLFLSVNVWANSTVYVVDDNTVVRSTKSEVNDQNILKTINKDQSLQRLTMHYSGWSLVTIDDIDGWVLSSHLTSQAPTAIINVDYSVVAEAAQYKKELQALTFKLSEANQKIIQFKESSVKISNTVATLTASIDALSLENSTLKRSLEMQSKSVIDLIKVNKNPNKPSENSIKDSNSNKNTIDKIKTKGNSDIKINSKVIKSDEITANAVKSSDSFKDTAESIVNWIYIGIVAIIILLLVFIAIYNNNKRRHFDLNTLRR